MVGVGRVSRALKGLRVAGWVGRRVGGSVCESECWGFLSDGLGLARTTRNKLQRRD